MHPSQPSHDTHTDPTTHGAITHWAIPITGIDPSRVSLADLHAVASRLADRHHWASPKPWSARPPRYLDGLCVLDIITLTDDDAEYLHTTTTPGAILRFGNQHATILTPPHPLTTTTWNDLHQQQPTTQAWTVEFRTPTTFGNRDRFTPWPDPSTVARSLTNRWNTFNPDPTQHLDQNPRNWHHIWVSDLDIHTELLDHPTLTIAAARGRIRYRCDDRAAARNFHRLLALAEYIGLGRYTTRGLGHITLNPTDSDPTHNRVASRHPKPARSVQVPHQQKQTRTSSRYTAGGSNERRSV